MQNRAYSVLDVKALSDETRTFSGVATSPSVDRVGDIIDPLGVKFAAKLPLLWQHRHDQPIGFVKFDKPTKSGITFTAEMPLVEEDGTLKSRIDEAWQSIKLGLVRAVSIGFRAIEYSFMDKGGIHFKEVEVYELSAVTIPANADAVISTVKSIDRDLRLAAGIPDPEIPTIPAASGKAVRVVSLITPPASRPPLVVNVRRS